MLQEPIEKAKNLFYRLAYPELLSAYRCETHLTIKECVYLFRLAKGKKYVGEIGSFVGASACSFGAALAKGDSVGGSKIICVDTWANHSMSEGSRDTWDEFVINTGAYSEMLVPVRGFSTEVVDKVREQTEILDLLFIDGDHSYTGAKDDWEAYKCFLREDSVVVFHDIGWAEGVQQVVRQDVLPLVKEWGRLPNMWWGVLDVPT